MKVRLTQAEIHQLIAMGFSYGVVIHRDVSVRIVGAIESIFRNLGDARREAKRLSDAYNVENSFLFIDLRHAEGSDR